MIGNGFDLNCGLRSDFVNVCKAYVNTDSENSTIKQFKIAINKDIETWGDFEMTMAEYASALQNENELLICVRDFKKFLNRYLIKEQGDFYRRLIGKKEIEDAVNTEMANSIKEFYTGITNSITYKMRSKGVGSIEAISYNYTDVFDGLLRKVLPYSPDIIHIHGSVSSMYADIVLGIDNTNQLKVNYELSNSGVRGFVKPVFNNQYDAERVERARELLKNAGIICIYGMSLGESDLTWRNLLFDLLDNEHDLHVFIYQYDLVGMTGLTADERLDVDEQRKRKLFDAWGVQHKEYYMDRIHIPCGHNIFNVEKAIMKTSANEKKGTVVVN